MPAASGNPNSAEPEQREMSAGRRPCSSRARGDADDGRECAAPAGREECDARLACPFVRKRDRWERRHGLGPRIEGERNERAPRVVEESGVVAEPVDHVSGTDDDVEVLPQPEDVENRTKHGFR